jgi:hypothetical protein
MIWDALMEAVVAMLDADAELGAALGGRHVYHAESSRPVRVPSVEWLLVDDTHTENHHTMAVQFDHWSRTAKTAATIERRLLTLLHRETRRDLGSISTTVRYAGGRTLDHPQPGVIHRALRFTMDPVRGLYEPEDAITTPPTEG